MDDYEPTMYTPDTNLSFMLERLIKATSKETRLRQTAVRWFNRLYQDVRQWDISFRVLLHSYPGPNATMDEKQQFVQKLRAFEDSLRSPHSATKNDLLVRLQILAARFDTDFAWLKVESQGTFNLVRRMIDDGYAVEDGLIWMALTVVCSVIGELPPVSDDPLNTYSQIADRDTFAQATAYYEKAADRNLQHLHDIAKQVGISLLDVTEYDGMLCEEVCVYPQIASQSTPISHKGGMGTIADDPSLQFQSDLRKGIIACFSMGDLRVLCADLGIDYESLGGEGKEIKALELISYMNRRGQITRLLEYLVSARPEYTWPQADASQGKSDQIRGGLITNARTMILFLASDPTDAARLRLGEELREIQEKLQLAKLRDRINLQQRMSVRPADISQALLDTQPQVVHFSGHGAASGELCFENVMGGIRPVAPDALAALFEQFADQVNCVVLNACFSEVQAKAIAQHISYVVGMKQAIGDQAAIAFTVGFYQALGAGRTVEEAHKLGCVQIRLQGIPEHLTPVLLKKG